MFIHQKKYIIILSFVGILLLVPLFLVCGENDGGIIEGAIQSVLAMTIGALSSLFLQIGTAILSFALSDEFISQSGSNSPVVQQGWTVVKNLANAALVIGLVIIAIKIILGKDEGKAKETLISFVIVALLINFTPLICGFFIDGANILARSFIGDGVDGSVVNEIKTVYANIDNAGTKNFADIILSYVTVLAFSEVSCFIYILYAMLFIARSVILWILIIASPIALATKVFPKSEVITHIFPNILHWDEWYKSFLQWCFIVIPAGLFIYLANIFIHTIQFKPLSNPSEDGWIASIFTALFSLLVPFIILLAGFFITISSGGAVAAPLKGVANKAWSGVKSYTKESGKGMAGAFASSRANKEGVYQSIKNVTNFDKREEGRAYFDSKTDTLKSKIGLKGYETRRKEDEGKKDFDSESDNIKSIDKDYDAKIAANPTRKLELESERDKIKQKEVEKAISFAQKEINIAETKGNKERAKDMKKKAALFLIGKDDTMLRNFESKNDVKIEDIVAKMSGADLAKNIGASQIKEERIMLNLNKSQIGYIMNKASPAQGKSLRKAAKVAHNTNKYAAGSPEEKKLKELRKNIAISIK